MMHVEEIDTGSRQNVELFGLVGLYAMVIAHLVWDPTVTAFGVAEFGIAEEDNTVVRRLWRIHPLVWFAAKGVAVGGMAAVVWRLGVYRHLVAACLLYFIAALGVVAPLGWVELLALN